MCAARCGGRTRLHFRNDVAFLFNKLARKKNLPRCRLTFADLPLKFIFLTMRVIGSLWTNTLVCIPETRNKTLRRGGGRSVVSK